MPVKNTKVTPNEIPQRWIFPNPNPIDVMRDKIITACKAECSKISYITIP